MFVVVIAMRRMPMTIVNVIHVIPVLHRLVPTVRAVDVRVIVVRAMFGSGHDSSLRRAVDRLEPADGPAHLMVRG